MSLSWFAFADIAGLIAMGFGQYSTAAVATAAAVAVIAAFLNVLYLVQRRSATRLPSPFIERRAGTPVPRHRRVLDRWVFGQWFLIGLLGAGVPLVVRSQHYHPFDSLGLVFDVLSIGWVVLWSGIYLSSLVDWFLILPKVSGISSLAPCERVGQQRWVAITNIWCFHRGAARLLVPFVFIGCPTVIGGLTMNSTGQAIAFVVAGSLSVFLIEFEAQGKKAISYGLNGRGRCVGDTVWLVHEDDNGATRLPAYTVDVAAEGAKFKFLNHAAEYTGPPFERKHDDVDLDVTLDVFERRRLVQSAGPPCGQACTGVNWYCWNNPLAHSQSSSP